MVLFSLIQALTRQYLSQNAFLKIISYFLPQILVDCTKNAAYLLETINLKEEQFQTRVSDNLSVSQIKLLHHQIDQVNSQIQVKV